MVGKIIPVTNPVWELSDFPAVPIVPLAATLFSVRCGPERWMFYSDCS